MPFPWLVLLVINLVTTRAHMTGYRRIWDIIRGQYPMAGAPLLDPTNARRWYLLSLIPRDTLEILLHKKYGEEPSALLMPE